MASVIESAAQKVKEVAIAGKEALETKTEKETREFKHQAPDKIQSIVFDGPNKVSISTRPFPSFHLQGKGEMQHAVIIKMIAAGICGSDLHAYTGRVAAKPGMTLGHENLGEVVEIGSQVRHIKDGDLVVLPFNISCGTCARCKEMTMQACESKIVNPQQTGGIYGYPMAGDWEGGQAQYLLVPWADYNCFQVDAAAIKGKLASITLMSDVLPTALHAVENAEVTVGKTVYIAGAGPIGLSCAHFSLLKGAAVVIVGDVNADRLKKAQAMGCLTIDCGKITMENMNKELSKLLNLTSGVQYVDCAIDAAGFESAAQGHGHIHEKHVAADRTAAINSCIQACAPGGKLSIPGVYLPGDPLEKAKGPLQFDLQTMFMKGLHVKCGQTPCGKYLHHLYKSIIFGRTDVTQFLNVRVIPMNEAPKAYETFSKGENVKYIIDPNGLFSKYNGGSLSHSGASLF